MNYIVATYLARFIGILFLIPAIFPALFYGLFPGLEDRRLSLICFVIGISIYAGASVIYYILRKKDLAKRKATMEELEKNIK